MADIGSLVVKIAADASGIQKTFDDLGGAGKQFQRGMESISKVISTAFFAATSAAVAMTIAAGKTAEETEQLAQKTGIAASVIEGMTVIMNRNGLSGQSMAMMMKALSKEMVGVQAGTASSIKLFSDMGISLDVVGKGTGATLRAIADRFKEMPDGAKKATLAVELFGRAGLEWIPILNKGSAAMDQAMKKSAEFGLILSETARTDLTVFDDAMDDLMSALKGFGMQVGIAFAPSMTILVKAFTDVIVFAKDVFNRFADAASVLSIRLAAMVASVQLLSSTLFSYQAFSKAAWQETMNHIKAIDGWAVSQIEGIEASRDAAKELDQLAMKHLNTSEAVAAHASSQKTLGEQIVATTKIQLQQIEELGKHQERLGGDIVSAAKVKLQVEVDEGKVQEALGLTINRNFAASQDVAQQWVDSYMVQEDAAMARFQAEMDAADHAQESMGRNIVAQTQAALQVKSFWTTQMEALVASNAFSVGQIVTTWTSGIANAIVRGGDFIKAAWESTQVAIIQGALNTGVQLAAQCALSAATEVGIFTKTASALLVGHTATESSMTAVSLAADAQRAAASVATSKIMGASAVGAVTAGATAMLGVMNAVVIAVAGTFAAIGAGLAASVVGAPFAPAFEVAAGAVIVSGTVALVLATGAVTAALAGATAASLGPGFSSGGIAFGPSIFGEAGPEAAIPLNRRGAAFMHDAFGTGGNGSGKFEQTIILDGMVLARSVAERLPSVWRASGLPNR